VYFYGSTPAVLDQLRRRLQQKFPTLNIAGLRSPPFRALTPSEEEEDLMAIESSGAGIVFVGLGCPRQERWAFNNRSRLNMPILCVGAAFDFHAGTLRQAPAWMQARGLEWAFRLLMEPRRLWRRYTQAVPLFIFLLGQQYVADRVKGRAAARMA
jgi:exopolysaccharide biosynthesis WecB/TagA/CpsF family protein